jgi:hypothetical protein
MSTLALADPPPGTTSPAEALRRTAAAVRMHFVWFGVHKTLTAQQKEEVSDTYGADARLLSAGKKILDVRHEKFRALTSLRSRIVSYWRGLTLPYVENGVRLIRQPDIEAFVHTMEGFRDELVQAEAELNAVFDQIKSDARGRLGRLYNPSDYPPEVQGLFHVDWDFPAVEPPSYLMRLSPELYQQEQERVARRFEEAVQLAEQAFIAEFAKLVSHLTERLQGGPGEERRIFRDSLMGNLTDFFDKFRHLNVGSSQELDRLVEQAQGLVRGTTAQELRDNAGLRQHVATEMTRVQERLEGMIIERPRRQIIRASASRNGGSHGNGH